MKTGAAKPEKVQGGASGVCKGERDPTVCGRHGSRYMRYAEGGVSDESLYSQEPLQTTQEQRHSEKAVSPLNCGAIDRCSANLNTATFLGPKGTYEDFATPWRDLRNGSKGIHGGSSVRHTATFLAKLISDLLRFGNANRPGRSINCIISPGTGEIFGILDSK